MKSWCQQSTGCWEAPWEIATCVAMFAVRQQSKQLSESMYPFIDCSYSTCNYFALPMVKNCCLSILVGVSVDFWYGSRFVNSEIFMSNSWHLRSLCRQAEIFAFGANIKPVHAWHMIKFIRHAPRSLWLNLTWFSDRAKVAQYSPTWKLGLREPK